MERKAREWGKTFAKYISYKTLTIRIYKEILKLKNIKTNNPLKKWAKSELALYQRAYIEGK